MEQSCSMLNGVSGQPVCMVCLCGLQWASCDCLCVLCADPYENGTPVWGADGTPKHVAKKGSKLSCSFDDSVEWLRPKTASVSKTIQQPAEEVQTAKTRFACPFGQRMHVQEKDQITASR